MRTSVPRCSISRRVRRDPLQPNLRQVHLIHRELFDEVTAEIAPGELGENVTTEGVDLLGAPTRNASPTRRRRPLWN